MTLSMRASLCRRPSSRLRRDTTKQYEVVDARVALAEQSALQAFESTEDLVHQPADFGEVASDRLRLVAHRFADARRSVSSRLPLRLRVGPRCSRAG